MPASWPADVRHATPLPGFNRFRGDRVNEEYLSKTAFDNLPRRSRLARRRRRQPGGPIQPCCNRMLARWSGAGTGIRARHVPDTSRNGGIDWFVVYADLKRLVMITEVGHLKGPGHSMWICGTGRSPCRASVAGPGSSRSASAPPHGLDRYLRSRARHAQAWRWQLWLGAGQPGVDDR
jgi:hypothetical protein